MSDINRGDILLGFEFELIRRSRNRSWKVHSRHVFPYFVIERRHSSSHDEADILLRNYE